MKRTAQVGNIQLGSIQAGSAQIKAATRFAIQPMPWFIQGAFHCGAFVGSRLPKYRAVIGRPFGNRSDYLNRLQSVTEGTTEESITHKSGGRRHLAANLL